MVVEFNVLEVMTIGLRCSHKSGMGSFLFPEYQRQKDSHMAS